MSAKAHIAAAHRRPTPFRYVGGNLSLDFVNTVDWGPQALVNELLCDYEALVEWSEVAGILSAGAAAELRRRAAAQPRDAQEAMEFALRVRGASSSAPSRATRVRQNKRKRRTGLDAGQECLR